MNKSPTSSQFPKLETKNLILRETKLSDASAIFEIFADDYVTRCHDLETATSIEQIKFLISRRAERFKNKEGILREYGFWKGKFHDLRLFSLLKKDYTNAQMY
ncbi:hypothetical protein NIES593_17665 [Hydrococcus rivularis NIES-593]|uniref:N-acetyltransferase domain-containing protein n=1 Tax=Hydrococcus rivularis NIES-593 TaxID=1921803 RepID=A0A1U7HBD1_9CYAN|nr:hypothetical protein [Hydrococcus rivularis]OKH20835.1 hypothetical protein NIES593_17665 [Hydrococcus rivularis NIES-593]